MTEELHGSYVAIGALVSQEVRFLEEQRELIDQRLAVVKRGRLYQPDEIRTPTAEEEV